MDALLGEAVRGAGGAEGGDDLAVVGADRGRHGVQPDLQLLQCHRVPAFPRLGQVLLQLPPDGQRVRGVLLQSGGREHLVAPLRRQVREQDLAAGRGVHRGELSDPVVGADGARAAHLVEVDRVVLLQDGDVDGLADLLAEPLAHLPALLGDVESARDRAGQAHDAEAEPVLAALGGLLDQSARLQRPEQAERGRLVDVDLGGDLADACLPALGEDLQDADGTVDGLHPVHRRSGCFALCGVVAHSATICNVDPCAPWVAEGKPGGRLYDGSSGRGVVVAGPAGREPVGQRKTTVQLPLASTRLSLCHCTARARTRASTSRPMVTSSSGVWEWSTRTTSCSMIGPSSRSGVT